MMQHVIDSLLFALPVSMALALASVAGESSAADDPSPDQLLRKSCQSTATGTRREYFVYLPVGYESGDQTRWPVIMFLHGGGERGNGLEDLDRVLVHGPLMEAWIQRRPLPFIMISPQLPWFDQKRPPSRGPVLMERALEGSPPPTRLYGNRPGEPMTRVPSGEQPKWEKQGPPSGWWMCDEDILAMLDATNSDYRTDPARTYLTGLSYGGYGTWHMGAAHPERWAAIAPICGAGNPDELHGLVNPDMPIWIFEGGRDPVVRPEWVLESAKLLEAAGHKSVRMTVHEDLGHNVWTRVYEGEDLYNWLLSHRRN